MKNWQPRLLLPILALALAASPASAAEQGCGSDPAASLRTTFPNYRFQEVNPTPIPGLFEVVSEKNIVYFAPASGHLIFGEIWSRDGKNLTALSREQHTGQEIANLPLDKAVRIGTGATTVIEFTDPDCPFCRKGAAFFKERTGVSRYIFFAPLTGLHPGATAKAEFILAAPDPARAYEEVMAGRYDNHPLPSFTDRGLLAQHLQIAARLGIKSTPRYWINTTPVNGFNPERLTALLDAGRKQNQQTTQRTPSR